MAAVQSRIATHPYKCGFCGHIIHRDQVIALVVVGSTESTGCLDCSWKAMNKALPSQREAAS